MALKAQSSTSALAQGITKVAPKPVQAPIQVALAPKAVQAPTRSNRTTLDKTCSYNLAHRLHRVTVYSYLTNRSVVSFATEQLPKALDTWVNETRAMHKRAGKQALFLNEFPTNTWGAKAASLREQWDRRYAGWGTHEQLSVEPAQLPKSAKRAAKPEVAVVPAPVLEPAPAS